MSTTMNTETGTEASVEAQRLRHEIEMQRSALGRDLEVLGDHVSPGAMVQRRRNAASQRIRGVKDRLMGVADSATSTVTGTASGATSAVGGTASSVAGAAGSVASSITGAPDMAKRQAQGSPIAMGLISFGVGVVAASVLPTSRKEQQLASKAEPMLQHAAEQAGTIAREGIDEITPKAKEVAEALKEDAADAARVVQERAQSGAAKVQEEAKGGAQDVAQQVKGS